MPQSSLRRAQVFGNAPGLRRALIVGDAASAVFVPLLVIDLGLILQLLVSRGGPGPVRDSGLGSWLLWQIVQVPLLGDFPFCLLELVAASWGLSLLEAGSVLWLRRLVNRYALRISTALRRAVNEAA